ncbi:MAG TPA: hypothetical protein VGQ05_21910 [Streptosporangiaceae bacterium]|jgi:hypothetical protein|nr:hypothetical protein [Streptosporangiaceae bacterium]
MPAQSNKDIESRLAAVEASLGRQPAAPAPSDTPASSRRVRDLVLRAASDPDFATELMSSPDLVGAENGLSTEQIEKVRMLSGQGLLSNVLQTRGVISMRPVSEGGGGYY